MSRNWFQCVEGWPANTKPWHNRKYFACQMASVAVLFICIICVSIGSKLIYTAVNIETNCSFPVRPFPREIALNTSTECLQQLNRKNVLLYSGYTLCTIGMFFAMAFCILSVMICCKGCHQLPLETEHRSHHEEAHHEGDEDLPTLPSYSDIANESTRRPTVHISPNPQNYCNSINL